MTRNVMCAKCYISLLFATLMAIVFAVVAPVLNVDAQYPEPCSQVLETAPCYVIVDLCGILNGPSESYCATNECGDGVRIGCTGNAAYQWCTGTGWPEVADVDNCETQPLICGDEIRGYGECELIVAGEGTEFCKCVQEIFTNTPCGLNTFKSSAPCITNGTA